MTTKAWAWSQPLETVASSIEEMSSKSSSTSRGYSDSEIPSCRASGEKKYHICHLAASVRNDLVAASDQSTNMNSLPPLVKYRQQHLQLPSFTSLGISSRVPDALLTPPDECIIHDMMTTPLPTSFPSASRRSSYPAVIMPKTPSPDRPDFTSVLGHVVTTSEASNTDASNQAPLAVSEAQAGNPEHGTDPSESDSGGSDARSGQFDWLMEATDALGKLSESHCYVLADHCSCEHRSRRYKLRRVHALSYPTVPSYEHRCKAERRE